MSVIIRGSAGYYRIQFHNGNFLAGCFETLSLAKEFCRDQGWDWELREDTLLGTSAEV